VRERKRERAGGVGRGREGRGETAGERASKRAIVCVCACVCVCVCEREREMDRVSEHTHLLLGLLGELIAHCNRQGALNCVRIHLPLEPETFDCFPCCHTT